MKNSWKKIVSKTVHKNSWFSLREDDVIRPDGNKGKYFVVQHECSIAVIAEEDDGQIWLVGQTRYPIGNIFSWEIIAGGVESGDDYIGAAKKELREEAGLEAQTWIKLGYFYPLNGFVNEKCFVFLAKDLVKIQNQLEPTEDIQTKKETIGNILKLIASNEITDGITLAAIVKYLFYKKRL